MFLRNYTSDVPVSQTIYRIEQVLIRCGVSGITKEYGPKAEVAALTFHIDLEGRRVTVRLPADVQSAWDALWLDYVDGDRLNEAGTAIAAWGSRKKKKKDDFREQAERTAWRLVQDWVEVQLSMIQLKQTDFVQVFLAYVWDESRRESFYGRLKASGYRGLLAAPKEESTA